MMVMRMMKRRMVMMVMRIKRVVRMGMRRRRRMVTEDLGLLAALSDGWGRARHQDITGPARNPQIETFNIKIFVSGFNKLQDKSLWKISLNANSNPAFKTSLVEPRRHKDKSKTNNVLDAFRKLKIYWFKIVSIVDIFRWSRISSILG